MSRLDAIQNAKRHSSFRGRGFFDTDRLEKEWNVGNYKPPEGDNFLQIIPPADENKYFGLELYVHYGIGPNDSAYLCLAKHKNKRCPICEEYERLQKRGADKEELRALNAWPPRWAFLVVDTSSKDKIAEGLKLFVASNSINDGILSLSENPRTKKMIDITDPKNGADLYFRRKGTKLTTKYEGYKLEDMTALPDKLFDDIADMPDLDDFLVFYSYEEIKEDLLGAPEEAEEETSTRRTRTETKDEEVEERPSRSRGSASDELPTEEEFKERRAAKEEVAEEEKPRRSSSASEDEEDIGRRVRERLSQTAAEEEKTQPAEDDDRPRSRRRRE